MSRHADGTPHDRLPLVYSSRAADEQGRKLGIDIVENRVAEAIRRGDVVFGGRGDGVVRLPGGALAVTRRSESPLTGRRAWKVIAVKRGGRV